MEWLQYARSSAGNFRQIKICAKGLNIRYDYDISRRKFCSKMNPVEKKLTITSQTHNKQLSKDSITYVSYIKKWYLKHIISAYFQRRTFSNHIFLLISIHLTRFSINWSYHTILKWNEKQTNILSIEWVTHYSYAWIKSENRKIKFCEWIRKENFRQK